MLEIKCIVREKKLEPLPRDAKRRNDPETRTPPPEPAPRAPRPRSCRAPAARARRCGPRGRCRAPRRRRPVRSGSARRPPAPRRSTSGGPRGRGGRTARRSRSAGRCRAPRLRTRARSRPRRRQALFPGRGGGERSKESRENPRASVGARLDSSPRRPQTADHRESGMLRD